MADQLSLATQDNLILKNQLIRTSLNLSNITDGSVTDEAYITAIGDGDNDTHYLSVLDSTEDITVEEFQNSELNNSNVQIVSENLELTAKGISQEEGIEQVVVFSLEGSDDLYGIQFAQDEDGNVQKYQFQFRTTEEGQLEAIPETIQLLPDEDNEIQQDETLETQLIITDNENISPEVRQIIQEEQPPVFLQEEEEVYLKGHLQIEETTAAEDPDLENDETIVAHNFATTTNAVFVKCEPKHSTEEEEEEMDPTLQQEDIKPATFELQTFNSDDNNIKQEIYENHAEVDTQSIPEGTNLILNTFEGEELTEEHEAHENEEEESSAPVLEYETYQAEGIELAPDAVEYQGENTYEEVYNEEISNGNDSDNEEYETIESVHITGDEDVIDDGFETQPVVFQQPIKTIDLGNKQNVKSIRNAMKKNKMMLYCISQKENVNSLPTYYYNQPVKTHPRSVLKCDVELRVIGDVNSLEQECEKLGIKNVTGQQNFKKQVKRSPQKDMSRRLKDKKQEVVELQDQCDKRFSRSKEAIQARLFNNFISKTTIPHAPVRQTRLPRKQEIRPVDNRRNEEIIVQEVMVSSNGFIENTEDRLKNKDKFEVTSIVELTDSDDEYSPKNSTKKKKKHKKQKQTLATSSDDSDVSVIEIPSEDDEKENGRSKKVSNEPEVLKRPRGRPPKVIQSQTDQEGSSPHKKSRTESSEEESDAGRKEVACPHCSKSFPSQNSLSTHIQHHNLENSLRKNKPPVVVEYKHKCEHCQQTFKNSILLKRHECKKKSLTCPACSKSFKDIAMLNIHKRSHVKQNLIQATSTIKISPKKISPKSSSLNKQTKKLPPIFKCKVCTQIYSTQAMLTTHEKAHKKYNCTNCKATFNSKLLLDTHLRVNCVKGSSPKDKRLSFKIRRSYMKSPAKAPARMSVTAKKVNPGLNPNSMSRPLEVKEQCDSCTMKFSTLTALFKHKVKEHNLHTPERSVLAPRKKYMHKPRPTHCGIPANDRLKKAFAHIAAMCATTSEDANEQH